MNIRKRLTLMFENIIKNAIESYQKKDVENYEKLFTLRQKFMNDHEKRLSQLRQYENDLAISQKKIENHELGKQKISNEIELNELFKFASNSHYEEAINEFIEIEKLYANNDDLGTIIKKFIKIDNSEHEQELNEKMKKMNEDLSNKNILLKEKLIQLSTFAKSLEELNMKFKVNIQFMNIKLEEIKDKVTLVYMINSEKIIELNEKAALLKNKLNEMKSICEKKKMSNGMSIATISWITMLNKQNLYEFTSIDQIFGDADCIYKECFIKGSKNYKNMFHFDSKRAGLFVGFDMSKNPKNINKLIMSVTGESNNKFEVQYSDNKFYWNSVGNFLMNSGTAEFKINSKKIYPYWRIYVTSHGGNKPWYNLEWFYEEKSFVDHML